MKRILIVDDHEEIPRGLSTALQNEYDIDVAHGGSEALQKFRGAEFSGVLLDVDLGGGMDGLELASYIRRLDARVRIVIFSAHDYADAVRNSVHLGATFLEKPVNPSLVRQALGGFGDRQP